jgi:protein TonB
MRFAAADNGGGALRRTVGTFEFAQPSARLRLPGEAAPPRGVATDSTENESNGEPGFGPSMAPRLANTEQVRAAMLGAYTSGMVDRKSTGTVGVWMLVDEQGFVVGRTVKTSSGQCRLDVAALEIASIMRFSPAMRNGKPMKVWVDMPLVFGSR